MEKGREQQLVGQQPCLQENVLSPVVSVHVYWCVGSDKDW